MSTPIFPPIQMLLLVVCLGFSFLCPTWAWIQQPRYMHRTLRRSESVVCLAAVNNNGKDEYKSSSSSPSCQRRAFLTWIATAAASITALPPSAHALPVMSMPTVPDFEADLQAFEKSLEDFSFNPSKWPESPSPLPTRVQSAQELTAPDNMNRTLLPQMPQSVLGPSELEQALKESIRKRRVEPLTHG